MTGIIFAVVAAIVIGVGIYFLNKKKKDNPPAPTPGPVTSPWLIYYSPNMPSSMTPNADGTFSFDFPTQDGVHYVNKSTLPLALGQTISMSFVIMGAGTMVPSEEADQMPTAGVHLYFQRAGDNISGQGEFEHYRWWSKESVSLLAMQSSTLSVKLQPQFWVSVYGKSGDMAPDQFAAALANAAFVGFTFGGMFYGHGVFVQGGPAKFTLRQYVVQ